jgi:hypothetical protein
MDPIHPIVPVTPGIGAVPPLTRTRRIDPNAERDPGRDPRGKHDPHQAPGGTNPDDEGDGTPHVDITA